MAQKKKPATRKKVANKKVRYGFFSRFSTRNLLIFAIVFAAIGGYTLWRSYAASTILVDYRSMDAVSSHGETVKVENSKKTSIVEIVPYNITNGINGRGVYVKSINAGIYKVCFIAKAVVGSPYGTFVVSNTIDGTALASKSYTAPAKYDQIGCTSVTHSTNGNLVFTVNVKPVGSTMRISYVTLDKTGNVDTTTPPPDTSGGTPYGAPANLKSWTKAFSDEFNGTSLDLNKWDPNWFGEGGKMNNVGTYASNVNEAGGVATLTLSSSGHGALFNTESNKGFAVMPGMYAEARVYFSGNGSSIYNWGAWWTSSNPYPDGGENDIAEVLSGDLTVNYHSKSGSHNQGAPSGYWGDAFHVYGLHRKNGSCDVYWDGKLVKSYSTDDNGAGEYLIFNIGTGSSPTMYGSAGQMKVDWVRVWK